MPTGYTEIIEREGSCTFEEYIWRCARAFGAFILQRDDSLEGKAPTTFECSPYHRDALDKAQRHLETVLSMPAEEADRRAVAAYEKHIERKRQGLAEYDELHAKYVAVRDRVVAWEPPSPEHEGLKRFMLEQIDVCDDGRPSPYCTEEPKRLTGTEWLEQEITRARRDVNYHAEYWEKEQRATAQRNRWVTQLAASVPQPEPKGEVQA
jgi:hypothetical protein